MEDKYKECREEAVKLLTKSLKQGEYFLFTKLEEDNGYGIILSRERNTQLCIDELTGENSRYEKILDALEYNDIGEWFTIKKIAKNNKNRK